MSEGLRLRHKTLKAAADGTLTFVVELPKPYPQPRQCKRCEKVHDNKAIHFNVDSEGYSFINVESWNRWQQHFELAGFEIANVLSNPPDMVLGAIDKPKSRIVNMRLGGKEDAITITPEKRSYTVRDEMWAPFTPLFEQVMDEHDRAEMAKKREKRTIYTLDGKE